MRGKQAFRAMAVVAILLLMVLGALWALAHHSALPVVSIPEDKSFDPEVVRRGARLAAIGNCAECHTASGGASFAGGVPVPTPFGTIYSTNITPDPQAGIGGWSAEAFRRALREGVSRDGHLLYPAFPYDHFTHLVDGDIDALYAFAMTRDPAPNHPPRNELAFPLQFRPLLAGWDLLFLHKGPQPATPQQTAEWNRGAYLTGALAHCEACHTPRDALGAEKRGEAFAGGLSEGWHAPALNAHSPSPVTWTTDALAQYLRTGIAPDHAISAGPMQEVVRNLSQAPEEDVHAIAVYVQSIMGPATAERSAREAASRQKAAAPALAALAPSSRKDAADPAQLALGQQVYTDTCARCHDAGRLESSAGGLKLPLAIALHLPDPRNLIHIVRGGIRPPDGHPGRWMPGFDGALTDEQITAVAIWLRHQGTDEAPWSDVAKAVQETRSPAP